MLLGCSRKRIARLALSADRNIHTFVSFFGPACSILERILDAPGDSGLPAVVRPAPVAATATAAAAAAAAAATLARSRLQGLWQDLQATERSLATLQVRVRQESQVPVPLLPLSDEAALQHVLAHQTQAHRPQDLRDRSRGGELSAS